MYQILVLCTLCLFVTHVTVIAEESDTKIIKYENTNDGNGNYKFSFETSNGIVRKEVGHLVNIGQEDEHMVVEGSYSYTDTDGKQVTVNYIADKQGYRVNAGPQLVPQVVSIPSGVVATLLGK